MHIVHKGHSEKVTFPVKRELITAMTMMLRTVFMQDGKSDFDIVGFLDKRFASLDYDPAFNLEVVEDEELPTRFGETVPSEHVIRVRQSVYLKAKKGDGFSRQVMAHELGHYLLHNAETVSHAYVDDSSHIPDEMNPEKQADVFAAELLAPSHEVRGMKIHQISVIYGVTKRTAAVQKQIGERTAAHRKATKHSPSKKQHNSNTKKKRSGRKPNRHRR